MVQQYKELTSGYGARGKRPREADTGFVALGRYDEYGIATPCCRSVLLFPRSVRVRAMTVGLHPLFPRHIASGSEYDGY